MQMTLHEEPMAPLQRAICLADRPAVELKQKPADDLKQKFVELVMCDFTPRHPSELFSSFPASRWVSFDRLYQLFQPHAAVSQRGPGNLRLRIIEWYKDDPAFIGLAPREWCKRVTSNKQRRATKWQRQNIPVQVLLRVHSEAAPVWPLRSDAH